MQNADASLATATSLDSAYVMPTFARFGVEFVKGEGAVLTDSAGKQYLDFLAGIGVVSLGHRHPAVVSALHAQIDRVWQVGNYYHEEHRGELACAIAQLLATTTDEIGHVTGSTGKIGRAHV